MHCPLTVGGHPSGVSRAEREIGLVSRSVSLADTYLGYPVDERIELRHSYLRNQAKIWGLTIRMLARADVVHYNFGTYPSHISIAGPHRMRRWAWPVEGLDVKLANAAGKVIAVTFQGDDARHGEYCREHYPIHFVHEVAPDYYSDRIEADRRARIDLFDRNANLIYALNPDLLNMLPSRARFLPYATVDPREWRPRFLDGTPAVPHIVHAPTNRKVKGTDHLIIALGRLREEGMIFRFTQVEGMSNADARRVYETADLLVDQLLAGYYGGLAVELMALGKPVIAYIREADMHHLPDDMVEEMPVVSAHPGTIYEVLREWLTERKPELAERGRQGRAYVERWHDPLKIAARLKRDYEAAA